MSNAREVKTQIVSVKSTQKITKAMQMVAVSKMRKAQDRMRANRPYSEYIRRVVGHIAQANTEYQHPFMEQREIKHVGIIIVSSDRGLCGGLNTNLFREVVGRMQELEGKQCGVELAVLGKKAKAFFKSHGGNVKASIDQINEVVSASDLIGGVKVMLDSFYVGGIDQLLIAYNSFENAMLHRPNIVQLVPLVPDDQLAKSHWDYIYEPDARELLDGLLVRYIESQVYHAVVENNACEQAARMMAMKNASDNAQDLISELGLIYNKARQAAITQELSEIVSGASAV